MPFVRARAADRAVPFLAKLRADGRAPEAGEKWTVEKWLKHWLENIAAPPNVSENTHARYRVDVEKRLIPGIGAHRLDRLQPEYVEKLYRKMQREGSKPGTAHHVHRTVRAALNEAVRKRKLGTTPVLLARAPRLDDEEIEPYDLDEVKRLLEVVRDRRNGVRWVVALALGLRQGEALGLKWTDLNLKKGTLKVRRGRLRPKYAHGCGGKCGRSAGYCPQKKQTPQGHGRHQVAGRPTNDRNPRSRRAAPRDPQASPGRGEEHRAATLARRGMGIRQAGRQATEPQHRLPRVESHPEGSRPT